MAFLFFFALVSPSLVCYLTISTFSYIHSLFKYLLFFHLKLLIIKNKYFPSVIIWVLRECLFRSFYFNRGGHQKEAAKRLKIKLRLTPTLSAAAAAAERGKTCNNP